MTRIFRAAGLARAKTPGGAGPARSTGERLVREWLMPLALVAVVVSPIRSVVADWNDVPTGSMRPTILEGDRITVNKLAFGLRVPFTDRWLLTWGQPRRGDIVTFASPMDGTRLVKRVVGLPGDRLSMRSNRLFVNGSPVTYEIVEECAPGHLPGGESCTVVLAREKLPGSEHDVALTPCVRGICSFPEQVVPEGSYFVMGDNRDLSNDSRVYGFVPRENLYGRCGYVALSVDPERAFSPRWERWGAQLK